MPPGKAPELALTWREGRTGGVGRPSNGLRAPTTQSCTDSYEASIF